MGSAAPAMCEPGCIEAAVAFCAAIAFAVYIWRNW